MVEHSGVCVCCVRGMFVVLCVYSVIPFVLCVVRRVLCCV